MHDLHAREVAELDGLPRQREDAGDDRLRRDDGRHRRQNHQRIERPFRREQIERIVRGGRIADQQRALAEVVEDERRSDDAEPIDLDRLLAEVPEVGVERFAAGGDQEDGAEDEKAV